MHHISALYTSPLSFIFYIKCFGFCIFMVLANFFALFSMPIPNITLICYGVALVLLWQCMPNISLVYLTVQEQREKVKAMSRFFLLFSLLWLATTILSFRSCFLLFPHPLIHACLAGAVYVVGFILGGVLFYQSCQAYHGRISPLEERYYQTMVQYKERLQEWKDLAQQKMEENEFNSSEKRQKYMQQASTTTTYSINVGKHIGRHLIFICLWLSIPFYLFMYIPYQNHAHYSEFPLFYQFAMIFTLLFSMAWIGKLLYFTFQTYIISERGIQIKTMLQTLYWPWYFIQSITIHGEILTITSWESQTVSLAWPSFSTPKVFLDILSTNLPFSLFYISFLGQRELQKILKKDYIPYKKKYEQAYLLQEKPEKRHKKSKK
ncbi:MAG TPA: hypothetical protein PLB63_01080 [Planctomycetota bacterium]|nr:hypothetical protein [Planctomycetota bacterium]HQB01112.1 hypothetical protein [Planctomycetota bacterium]